MHATDLTDVLIVSGVLTIVFVLYRVVMRKRKVGGNPELWGTVFEALSHYVQPQDALKEPKKYINQQKTNDAEGKDNGEDPLP